MQHTAVPMVTVDNSRWLPRNKRISHLHRGDSRLLAVWINVDGFFRTQVNQKIPPKRTQIHPTGSGLKVRSVFGRQFHIIFEGLLACPLIDWFLSKPSICTIGLNLFEQSLLTRRYAREERYWITGDWHRLDRTCLGNSWQRRSSMHMPGGSGVDWISSGHQLVTACHTGLGDAGHFSEDSGGA